MNAYLDDRLLDVARPSLAAALDAGTAAARERGRIVVEVRVAGETVPDAALERPSDDPIEGEVRLVSVEPRSLVRVTLLDAADALEAAREGQAACADAIDAGDVARALEHLGDALAVWQTVRDAVDRCVGIAATPDFPGGQVPSDGLSEAIAGLSGVLADVRGTLQRQDWAALSDALRYDLESQILRWLGVLRALADGLRSPA